MFDKKECPLSKPLYILLVIIISILISIPLYILSSPQVAASGAIGISVRVNESFAPERYDGKLDLSEGDSVYVINSSPGKNAHIWLGKWDNEAYLSIGSPVQISSAAQLAFSKYTWDTEAVAVNTYLVGKKLEYEFILKSPMATNSIQLPIEYQNLEFYYQPALTTTQRNNGMSRPDNVVGSYAVYHSSKENNTYKTGKAFHIFRPELIDSKGTRIWATLNINTTTKLMTITWDKAWADKAIYPVTIDPTFGYETNGQSYQAFENVVIAETGTMGAVAGTGNYIKAYMNSTTAAHNAKGNVYNTSEALITNGATAEVSVATTGAAWYQMNFNSAPTLAASTAYRLAVHGSSTSGVINMYIDSAAGYTLRYQSQTYTSGFPNPASWSTAADTRASIYCDYTESSAPAITVSPITYDFGTVAASATPYTDTDEFTIDNTSTMQTDQTISVTTNTWSGGNGWTHSDTATAGEDTAGLLANKGGSWGSGDVIIKNTGPNSITENQAANTDYSFGLMLLAPTYSSDVVEKEIVIRVSAVAG